MQQHVSLTEHSRHEHVTPILQELHWLPITRHVQFKVLAYTFKALHNEASIYLCDQTLSLAKKTYSLGRRVTFKKYLANKKDTRSEINIQASINEYKKIIPSDKKRNIDTTVI